MNKPKIKTTEQCIVFSYQDRVKDVSEITSLVLTAIEEFTNNYPNIKSVSPVYSFLTYPDGNFKENNFTIKYCQAVETAGEDYGNFKFETIPARKVVSLLFKGSYKKLNDAYNEITDFIIKNNLKPLDPVAPVEIYISGPWNKTFPEDFETEIQIAIE